VTFAAFDPANDEDGLPIVLSEPRQSWKANLFWGLGLGLPAIILPIFAPSDADVFEKWGMMVLGVAWLGFMGANAYRNFGRTVRCDMETISVSQAFASKKVPLADVAGIQLEDVRQQLREFDEIGMSWRDKARHMDTTAPIHMYVLRDTQGGTLLRIDAEMEPPAAMRKFVKRVERAVRARAASPAARDPAA
jgi:hypothetical protein